VSKDDEIMDAAYDYMASQFVTEVDNEILNDIFEVAGSKRIYTSNYARNSNNPHAVSISASSPPHFEGKRINLLAPTWDMIKKYKQGKINEEQYSQLYIDLLKSRNLTPESIYNSIPHRTVMLCYEKRGDFCHRRVLAEWIEQALGVEIPEWESEEEVQKLAVVDSLLDF